MDTPPRPGSKHASVADTTPSSAEVALVQAVPDHDFQPSGCDFKHNLMQPIHLKLHASDQTC